MPFHYTSQTSLIKIIPQYENSMNLGAIKWETNIEKLLTESHLNVSKYIMIITIDCCNWSHHFPPPS